MKRKKFICYMPVKIWIIIAFLLAFGVCSNSENVDKEKASYSLGTAYWEEINSSISPECESFYVASDDKRGKVIIFGGRRSFSPNNYEYLDDTWEFDCQDWEKINCSNSPSPRYRGCMAYDKRVEKTILFGGVGPGTDYLSETWEYYQGNWTKIITSSAPEKRIDCSMAYHDDNKTIYLFGGRNDTHVFNDLWIYDSINNNWVEVPKTNPCPDPRGVAGFAYDTNRNKLILHGGMSLMQIKNDTWEFDDDGWMESTPSHNIDPARGVFGFTYDPFLKRAVLFGGLIWGKPNLDDTWEYDGSDWIQVSPDSSPSKRAYHSLVYHTKIKKTLLFGGSSKPESILNDTWAYSRESVAPTLSASAGILSILIFSVLIATMVVTLRKNSHGKK